MSPLDRLLTELVPTRPELVPTRPEPAQPWPHWTEQQQNQHWNDLCEAVGTPNTPRPQPTHQPKHHTEGAPQ